MAASNLPHTTDISEASGELPAVPWDRVERFVGQLTHDIRNGLNALELQLTYLGEISTDPEAADEIKRLRATVGNVTRQLQTLRTATSAVIPRDSMRSSSESRTFCSSDATISSTMSAPNARASWTW